MVRERGNRGQHLLDDEDFDADEVWCVDGDDDVVDKLTCSMYPRV